MSMTVSLVTFCNAAPTPRSCCALVEVPGGSLREVPLDYQTTDVGAAGVAMKPGGGALVAMLGTPRVVELDADLAVVDGFADERLSEAHSAAVVGDSLYIVATGTDSVVEYAIETNSYRFKEAHRLTESGTDSVHVNSICVHEGRLLVSMFGRGPEDGPLDADVGVVVDLADRSVVSAGLRQPHTLVSHGGQLYVLGSYEGTVELVRPDGGRDRCAQYPGYLRGMDFFDGGAVVGVSAARRRSRALGTTNASDISGEQCGLLVFDGSWRPTDFVDLTWYGAEIYDVTVMPEQIATPTRDDSLAAARGRIAQLERSWEYLIQWYLDHPG